MAGTVFVSQGDIAGAGWQAFLELLKNQKKYFNDKQCEHINRLVVVGDLYSCEKKIIEKLFHLVEASKAKAALKNSNDTIQALKDLTDRPELKKQLPYFIYTSEKKEYRPGYSSAGIALRSYQNFNLAAKLTAACREPAGLITLPVSKEMIMKAGVNFIGHTEVLAETFNRSVTMCMYHPQLSVVTLTTHLPLKRVPAAVSETDFENLGASLGFFQNLFKPRKPFAMTGLNPHAGENGKIGTEEAVLKNGLSLLQKNGIHISGPYAADTIFTREIRKKYSLVVACYHDQALIPFKALFGMAGVNITLNLPVLRVSPDHGVAYDAAAEEQIDVKSVLQSLLFSFKWTTRWKQLS